eukprot:1575121-Amphidinium_carterae.1
MCTYTYFVIPCIHVADDFEASDVRQGREAEFNSPMFWMQRICFEQRRTLCLMGVRECIEILQLLLVLHVVAQVTSWDVPYLGLLSCQSP